MTSVKAHLEENSPERVEKFVSNVQGAVKRILSDLKNFQVDTGFNFTPFLLSIYNSLLLKVTVKRPAACSWNKLPLPLLPFETSVIFKPELV